MIGGVSSREMSSARSGEDQAWPLGHSASAQKCPRREQARDQAETDLLRELPATLSSPSTTEAVSGKRSSTRPDSAAHDGRFRAVAAPALSTGNAVGLAVICGAFIVFALLSALVIPRRWPQYPGARLGWFIAATLVFFVATLGAVEVFAKEEPEEAAVGETVTEPEGTTTEGTTTEGTTTEEAEPPPPPAAAEGDPAAGRGRSS